MRCSCQYFQTVRTMIILGVMLIAGISHSAEERKTQTMTVRLDGEVFLFKEFGGLITESDDTVRVEMVMPAENRTEKYKAVDIQAGDAIKMINGKSLTSVKDLKKIYEGLAIGDEIKLGLFRGKRMLIAQFEKADPDELPGKMMIMANPGSDNDAATALINAGLILSEKDGKIMVDEVIDNMMAAFSGKVPQKGDAITAIQGTPLTSPEQLKEIYNKIESGKSVELTLLRKGDKIAATFQKPNKDECPATKMMKVKKTGE